MATDLLVREGMEEVGNGIYTAVHDIDELIRQIESIDAKVSRLSLMSIVSVSLVISIITTLTGNSMVRDRTWWSTELIWLLSVLLIPTCASFAIYVGWDNTRARSVRTQLLQLLRQTAPALVHQGKLSELRWATIKIMLSRYGI